MKGNVNTSSQTVRTCDVFISYRRDGGDMTAMYFYQALKERGYGVFYDLEVLRAGKFNEALLSSIRSCKDFVVILSPNALDRCNEENDWVRQEIAEALRSRKNIVPVMLKGFEFPETLPDDIDDIRYQNGLTCTTEYFEESINRLCERYLQSLPRKEKKPFNPKVAVLAVIAVLAVAAGGFLATRGGITITPAATATPVPSAEPVESPTPEPVETPTAEPADEPTEAPKSELANVIEITALPEIVVTADKPTEEPTEAPTAAPTEEPAVKPVRNTSFPALIRGMDTAPGVPDGDTEEHQQLQSFSPAFNHPSVQRKDVRTVTFLPSLDDAPADALDVSEAGDGRVRAWVGEPENGLYDLYIGGDGGVKVLECDGTSPMFSGFTNLERVDFNGCVDFSERTNFGRLFWCCNNLKEVNFAGVYTGNVISFSGMFGGCWAIESLDLSGFDTGRADTLDGMFLDCENLRHLNVSGFRTSRCSNMESMFSGCRSLTELDVTGFDTSHVQQMEYMFHNCSGLESLDVSHFDTSRVVNMERMFGYCDSLKTLDVSGFDTRRVTNMSGMFIGCRSLERVAFLSPDAPRLTSIYVKPGQAVFDTSRVEDMSVMFEECEMLDSLDIGYWDTGRVKDMNAMFHGCVGLYSLDLSRWDTSSVTNMTHMFNGCDYAVELLVTDWDISRVEEMSGMFQGCVALESIGRDPEGFGHGNTLDMYDDCERLTNAE